MAKYLSIQINGFLFYSSNALRKRLISLYTNCIQGLFTMNKYGKVKTFRLDKQHENLLNECFDLLNVKEDKFNVAMRSFIEKAHTQLTAITGLKRTLEQQTSRIKELESEKPQPTKSEAFTPTKTMQKREVTMKPTKKPDDWLVCPDRDDWVRKSVECEKCSKDNFKKFKSCWIERRQNPLSDLFKCSKPKPN